MKYLLDTHTLIWTLSAPDNLSESVRDIITDTDNALYVSVGVLWEIVIKQSLGKLDFDADSFKISDECVKEGIEILPIEARHLETLRRVPFIHRDPFDRLYIAQAICDEMIILTRDSVIPRYDVSTLW